MKPKSVFFYENKNEGKNEVSFTYPIEIDFMETEVKISLAYFRDDKLLLMGQQRTSSIRLCFLAAVFVL